MLLDNLSVDSRRRTKRHEDQPPEVDHDRCDNAFLGRQHSFRDGDRDQQRSSDLRDGDSGA